MLLDLDLLKSRLGIPADDDTKDAVIEMVGEQAQALAENYCDRKFDYGVDDETFPGVTRSFQVRRYPIKSVEKISVGTDLDEPDTNHQELTVRRVDPAKGLVWPGSYNWAGAGGQWPVIHCEYTGGYIEPPIDLYWALSQIFDELWASTPGAGLEPGDVGGGSFDAVKRFSVVGAYSVELGSTGDAGGGSGSGGGDNTWGILSPGITAVLDGYRRAARIGIG